MSRLRLPGSRAELIPGLLAVGVFVYWASDGGGYAATSWYPGSLFLLGLLAVAGFAYRDRLAALRPAQRLALAFLAAFAAWSFLSILWAGVPGVAFDGANRALLYLIVFALFSVVSWRADSAALVIGLYALGVAGVVLAVVLDAAGSGDASLALINGRFAEPMGYSNAVAALCIGAAWPAAYLASSRDVHWSVRGVFLAAAGVLIEVALLPQSRGAIIVFPIALVVYLAVVPNRVRSLLFLLPVGAAAALAAPVLFDVFTVADAGGDPAAALVDARGAILTTLVVLLFAGTAIAFLDQRFPASERVERIGGRVGGGLIALAALAGVVVAIAAIGNPISWAGDRWDDFKGGYDAGGFGSTRLSGDLGSNRYDFWRVAIDDQFLESPVIGDGADNFAVPYIEHRHSDEEPLYPHSLPIQVLAGTGVVGGFLLGGFLVSAVVAVAFVRRRSASHLGRGVAAVALAALGYWWLHGLGDWLWAFPALTAPIFAWLAMSSSIAEPAVDREPDGAADAPVADRESARVPVVAVVACGAVAVFAVVSLALPWIAARDVEIASSSWSADPDAAFERLDRAAKLNFLSAEPDLTAGAIASELGDLGKQRESFTRALERDPDNWFARLQLGAADAQAGRVAAGIAELEKASALNPRSELINAAIRSARRGHPIPVSEINRRLLRRVCSVVGNTEDTQFCK